MDKSLFDIIKYHCNRSDFAIYCCCILMSSAQELLMDRPEDKRVYRRIPVAEFEGIHPFIDGNE